MLCRAMPRGIVSIILLQALISVDSFTVSRPSLGLRPAGLSSVAANSHRTTARRSGLALPHKAGSQWSAALKFYQAGDMQVCASAEPPSSPATGCFALRKLLGPGVHPAPVSVSTSCFFVSPGGLTRATRVSEAALLVLETRFSRAASTADKLEAAPGKRKLW